MASQHSSYTAVIQYDEESKAYMGSIPAIPGCCTYGETLKELRDNLKEALELCLEVMAERGELPLPVDTQVTLEKIELPA